MKLTYNSVWYDGTGYSQAAINTALALDAANVDITCRNIKLATQTIEPPNRIKELLKKDSEKSDIVIQHILPPYLQYYHGFKNIGYAHFETSNFKAAGWQYYLNLMDAILVSSEQNKEAAIKSGVTKPVHVIDIPCNQEKYYHPAPIPPLPLPLGKSYVFYCIGDYSSRKNIENLIKVYFNTFTKADNVSLVLKCYVESQTGQESAKTIMAEIDKIKHGLRRFNTDAYPKIYLLPEYLSETQIMSIHNRGDCFITLERGAAWCLPAFDAAAMGKWVICNGWGGQTRFIKNNINGNLLDYRMTMVDGMVRCPYNTLYTSNEIWADPCLMDCSAKMRHAYENRPRASQSDILTLTEEFGYISQGKKIKEILENL